MLLMSGEFPIVCLACLVRVQGFCQGADLDFVGLEASTIKGKFLSLKKKGSKITKLKLGLKIN